jgi:heat shock protein HtpX
MNMPRLEIIESHARNAFASGLGENSFRVTVTRGLMQSLTKDELEAVLAHELTHILNRDVRLLIITIIFTGMIGFVAQLAWSNLRYALWFGGGSRNNRGGGMVLYLAIAAILALGYLASILARFAISRRREYMADAGAVQMTRNPDGMMRALMRIAGSADIPKLPQDVKMMCFENRQAFLGLFATHPPIEKRVQTIAQATGRPVPTSLPTVREKLSLPRAERAETFQNPWANPTPRTNWTTRRRFSSRR